MNITCEYNWFYVKCQSINQSINQSISTFLFIGEYKLRKNIHGVNIYYRWFALRELISQSDLASKTKAEIRDAISTLVYLWRTCQGDVNVTPPIQTLETSGNMLVSRLLLEKNKLLIDWCLASTLAIFQLYLR